MVAVLLRLRFRVLANTLRRNKFQLVAVILGALQALALVAVAVGGLRIAAAAPPAAAGTFTLTLTGPPAPPQVGQPMVLQATGTMPPEDVTFPYFMIVAAISRSVLPTCPPATGTACRSPTAPAAASST